MGKRLINPKKFIMTMDEEVHKDIKRRADFRGISMSSWILIAIRERVEKELDQGVFNEPPHI